jgi:hypothetical protein
MYSPKKKFYHKVSNMHKENLEHIQATEDMDYHRKNYLI